MQQLQPTIKIDPNEFLRWLERIPEPERRKHSPSLLATLFVVEKAIQGGWV